MSRRIYLLRHGKANIEGKRCIGLTDVPLSEEGRLQAKKIGTWLKERNIQKVYSSPLSRCRETAKLIVGEVFDRKKTIHIREDLREMSVGHWENLTFDEIRKRHPEEYEKRGANLGYFAPFEGESFEEAGKRFEECVNVIRGESDEDILIVAHAGVIRGYLCHLLGVSLNDVMTLSQPYGGLTVLEDEPEQFHIKPVLSCVGWKPYQLMDEDEIQKCYKKCKTPEQVIRHMRRVAEFIASMKESISEDYQNCYDWELLRKAALLHDILRTEKNHAKTGADYLEKEGYTEISELIRYHHDSEISEGEITEAEILFYADKRVQEDKVVTVEERFATSKRKCQSEEALKKHEQLYRKTVWIEEKLKIIELCKRGFYGEK